MSRSGGTESNLRPSGLLPAEQRLNHPAKPAHRHTVTAAAAAEDIKRDDDGLLFADDVVTITAAFAGRQAAAGDQTVT